MQIGPARDQIVRVLQRITLPFVRGEDVLRGRLLREIDELRGLAEHLPAEPAKAAVPIVSPPPLVDGEQPVVSTEQQAALPMTNPPTVHPRVEPQMSATPHPAVPSPFPTSDSAAAAAAAGSTHHVGQNQPTGGFTRTEEHRDSIREARATADHAAPAHTVGGDPTFKPTDRERAIAAFERDRPVRGEPPARKTAPAAAPAPVEGLATVDGRLPPPTEAGVHGGVGPAKTESK